MRVGLDELLDFQGFLLESNEWQLDGNPHNRIIDPGSDLVAYLKLLARSGRVCMDAGDELVTYFSDVDCLGNRLRFWGHNEHDSDYDPGVQRIIVPKRLRIAMSPDPRYSYVEVDKDYEGVIPIEEFEHEAMGSILFYPEVSIVPASKRILEGNIAVARNRSPDELIKAIEQRLERLYVEMQKRWPLMDMGEVHKTSDDSKNLNVMYSFFAEPSRHEQKREYYIRDWLRRNIPFSSVVQHMEMGSTPRQVCYCVGFVLPKE